MGEDVGVSHLDVGVVGFSMDSLVLSEGVERAEEDPECEVGRSTFSNLAHPPRPIPASP